MNPYAQSAAASVATPAVDAMTQGVANMFNGGSVYNTTQSDNALGRNVEYARDKTKEQLALELENLKKQLAYQQQIQQGNAIFMGNVGNASANARSARQMAENAQIALNNVYQNSGDRVNRAAADIMHAVNSAGNAILGMF